MQSTPRPYRLEKWHDLNRGERNWIWLCSYSTLKRAEAAAGEDYSWRDHKDGRTYRVVHKDDRSKVLLTITMGETSV